MKNDFQNKTAVITGASSGIGEATARRLASAGLQVTLVARRVERLLKLKKEIEATGGKAKVIAADLSLEADRSRMFETVQAEGGAGCFDQTTLASAGMDITTICPGKPRVRCWK